MAITHLQFPQPIPFQGLEDYAPEEMREFAKEMIRRNQMNFDAMIRALRAQVPVDTSILPGLTGGASSTSSHSIATTEDIDRVTMQQIMWEG